jgi:alpha-glucosidase (family GH31 glycosyl hydrolase)
MNTLSIFGISSSGADICGFVNDTTEELCSRWVQVGAFSSFMRNHNSLNAAPQEFYRWKSVSEISKNMISMRYQLLSYLYTLLYLAHSTGSTVHNALWTHFPQDKVALSSDCDSQFMWADSLLFIPVIQQGQSTVDGYFPAGVWYLIFDFYLIFIINLMYSIIGILYFLMHLIPTLTEYTLKPLIMKVCG